MTLETDIVEALRTSHATHRSILAEIARLKGETEALRTSVASLERNVATREAANVNVVEPSAAQPVIDDLMRHVEALRMELASGAPAVTTPPFSGPAGEAPSFAPEPPGAAPSEPPAEAAPGSGPRSSARAWTGPAGARRDPSTPMAPEPAVSSRLSRFGFRSG